MSLAEFDTLRAQHPEQGMLIAKFEDAVLGILRRNPTAVLDERHLAQVTNSPLADVELLLMELIKAEIIEPRVAWVCPIRHGTALEVRELKDLPLLLEECALCGQSHQYDPADVEIFFVPTARLLESITSEP
jgi:hypothetical protein